MNGVAEADRKLESLRLKGAEASLGPIIERAQSGSLSCQAFLDELVNKGFRVCYERMTNLVKILSRADIARSAQFRLSRLTKSDLVIIDEIGYTPIERNEANLFFTFVSDLYERTSIVVTSNKLPDSWAELLGDEVMTTALLDRLIHHAKIFSLSGESYRVSSREEE